jgi:hypothetical protein
VHASLIDEGWEAARGRAEAGGDEAAGGASDVTMQVALPRTWLLREGWRRAGSISPWDTPSA